MVDRNRQPKFNTVLNRRRRTSATDSSAPLYHPSIFRFTCQGKFSLDSRVQSAGVCKGIQSKLELVDHWRLTTKDEAIRVFEHKNDVHEAPSAGGATFEQQENSTAAAQSLELVDVSNVLVYPRAKKEGEMPLQDDGGTEKWKCYGSTEVDLLVLRPKDSKEETIAAVAPYCSPGSSVRDVSSSSLGMDRTTTIRLGVLEILYQANVAEEEEDDPIADDNNKQVPASQSSNQEVATKSDGKGFPTRFWNSSNNVLMSMKINAQLVYHATQEDFPERTVKASGRVVNEFSKTLQRTTSLMKRVLFWDWDGGDRNP